MDTSKNNCFEWLDQEVKNIKSNRFHIFEKLSPIDLVFKINNESLEIRGSYADFLVKFGYARFFTDHQDTPVMSVYPLKEFRRVDFKDGSSFFGFGFRGGRSFYFSQAEILSMRNPWVYQVGRQAKCLEVDFSQWLKDSYEVVKSRYSPRAWKRVLEGPAPFSAAEMNVVGAREKYSCQIIGFSDNGDALIRVVNNSEMNLPYITVGVEERGGDFLDGSVWLDVGGIGPGTSGVIAKNCYKDIIPPSKLQLRDMPTPIPEKRDRYWEFGIPE